MTVGPLGKASRGVDPDQAELQAVNDSEGAEREITRLHLRLDELRRQLSERLTDIRELREANERLRAERDALQSELTGIQSTKLFRLTRKPRAVYAAWLRSRGRVPQAGR